MSEIRATALVTILTAAFFGSTGMSVADTFKGVCTVTAGSVGQKKYATLKCYKENNYGNYVIRSTAWERDGKEEYQKLARISGRRFTCEFSRKGTGFAGDTMTQSYKMTNCR